MLNFFTDPILRSSTLGSMLMCCACALVGVVVVLRKRSLLGETLSHAAFPGAVIGVAIAAHAFPLQEGIISASIWLGACCFALLGLQLVDLLEKKYRVKPDSALCFVLAAFFGLGVLVISFLQQTHPLWYRQALVFLYGQAATMTDMHVLLYGWLSLLITAFILYFYRYLEIVNFDPIFAGTLGIESRRLDRAMFFLVVLAIVIGIRSVGVVLMAGLLICPAVAARPWTRRLSSQLCLAGGVGLVSGLLGNYLSVTLPRRGYTLPTGPMILLSSSLFCFFSLLLAPRNGLLIRYFRMRHFRFQCALENGLKAVWKDPLADLTPAVQRRLQKNRWIDSLGLTIEGKKEAAKIVRLHRLWELYLVDYLGQQADKVHRTAEELEHLFSPEIEKQLTDLLHNPRHDPHSQPIPPSLSPRTP